MLVQVTTGWFWLGQIRSFEVIQGRESTD